MSRMVKDIQSSEELTSKFHRDELGIEHPTMNAVVTKRKAQFTIEENSSDSMHFRMASSCTNNAFAKS